MYASEVAKTDVVPWSVPSTAEAHCVIPQSGLGLTMVARWPIPPQSSIRRTIHLGAKRALDILLSLLAIVAFAPLLVLVSAAIKMSTPGPTLYVQTRVGLNGRPFAILKFRTMYWKSCDASGTIQVRRDDRRVTPLGRVLRKTSIDELPQLFNVLVGDMSLIGPRPHASGTLAAGVVYEDLVPYYTERFQMRPGISGWAQANGFRGPTTDESAARARIDHDIAYVQNFSIWLDLTIIWMTIKSEFFSGTGL